MYIHSKTVSHFPCQFLLVALICGLCSCASNSRSSSAKSRPAANLYADNQWHMRLESDDKAEQSRPFEVNGRRMVLKKLRFNPMQLQPDGRLTQNHVTYYGQLRMGNIHLRTAAALLDADTGETILPMDYAEIIPIPGHAVYVMHGKDFANSRSKWSELDIATGQLKPANILSVFVIPVGSRRWANDLILEPQKHAVAVVQTDPESSPAAPLIQMQVFPAPLARIDPATYSRVKSDRSYGNSFYAGRYLKLHRVAEDGSKTTVLIDDDGTFCLETDHTIGVFTYRKGLNDSSNVFTSLGIRAPGTDVTDDLWLILDDSGRFGAPAGTLGFRPLHTYWTAEKGADGRALAWLVRYATEGENQIKWEALGPEFKPLDGHYRYQEAILFESPWFEPPSNRSFEGSTRNRPFLAVKTPGGSWELHANDNPPDLTNSRRRLILSGSNFDQLQSKLETKLEKDLIAYAAYEKTKAEQERKNRHAALERDFQNALNKKAWATADGLAAQLGGDAYYRMARTLPSPSVLSLKRALERTSNQYYKDDLKKMMAAAQIQYDNQLAEHQSWQQRQNSRRSVTGGASSYTPSAAPPKTMAQYMHDHAQAARYKDNSSYSQHKVNMGWYRPSGY